MASASTLTLSFLAALLALTAPAIPAARAAHFPSARTSQLEHLLVDSQGFGDGWLYRAITPCSNYVSSKNTALDRATAAQWMRVAFHDFSTADISAGTGGLDSSIVFEYLRPENSGQSFPDSFAYWKDFYNPQVSFSDLIAMGTVSAIASCAGPQLTFSGGRVDATQAGQSGVPEPDSTITDTLSRLASAGFNQTDAITLTACGHTVGRVHATGFPLVVPSIYITPNNTGGGVDMDSTALQYDNTIAKEYMAGTTQNMLVISPNVSQRSDFRMFNSDNNVTMSKLADSSSLFTSECVRLTTKMLNTVPSGVSLSPITPIAVKPVNVTLAVDDTGTMQFSGAIRLLGTKFSANSDRNVTITYMTRDYKTQTLIALTSASQVGSSKYLGGAATYYYTFNHTIDGASGITSFTVSTQESPASRPATTAPFVLQDVVTFLPAQSTAQNTTTLAGTLAAAVRKDQNVQSVVAQLSVATFGSTPRPELKPVSVPLSFVRDLGSAYALYQSAPWDAGVPLAAAAGATFDLVATTAQGSATDEFRNLQEAVPAW